MKKRYTLFAATLLAAIVFVSCTKDDDKPDTSFAASVTASTMPQEKNALVEHFTGVQSEQSAIGHRILNGLLVTHPGRIFCININTGYYSNGVFTTEFGTDLAVNSQPTDYPSGTVNRHFFGMYSMDSINGGTAIPITYFANAADIIMGQTAIANLDAKAKIDSSTRELSVAVAIYYTEMDTVNPTHKLNVALIEDSLWGRQEGGSTQNPTQFDFDNSQYCHKHVLRHLVTGQWGVDIIPTTGRQIRKVVKYTIPDQISGVDVNLKHLKVITFLAVDKDEVINVCEAPIVINQ
ncbi:MAG: Omp28-related outer membrane protein [Bacteroidales bacterium]|nr:Omp28-related outer membrane protein [Bacteroidales bacterium]